MMILLWQQQQRTSRVLRCDPLLRLLLKADNLFPFSSLHVSLTCYASYHHVSLCITSVFHRTCHHCHSECRLSVDCWSTVASLLLSTDWKIWILVFFLFSMYYYFVYISLNYCHSLGINKRYFSRIIRIKLIDVKWSLYF